MKKDPLVRLHVQVRQSQKKKLDKLGQKIGIGVAVRGLLDVAFLQGLTKK